LFKPHFSSHPSDIFPRISFLCVSVAVKYPHLSARTPFQIP
jgi:hypothetical protein